MEMDYTNRNLGYTRPILKFRMTHEASRGLSTIVKEEVESTGDRLQARATKNTRSIAGLARLRGILAVRMSLGRRAANDILLSIMH